MQRPENYKELASLDYQSLHFLAAGPDWPANLMVSATSFAGACYAAKAATDMIVEDILPLNISSNTHSFTEALSAWAPASMPIVVAIAGAVTGIAFAARAGIAHVQIEHGRDQVKRSFMANLYDKGAEQHEYKAGPYALNHAGMNNGNYWLLTRKALFREGYVSRLAKLPRFREHTPALA